MAEKTTTKKTAVQLPTVKDLLEAGAHFGHETKRWNPQYAEFIYTKRGGFHIIDLENTCRRLGEASVFLQKAAKGGDIIMVGTKRQARDIVREEAIRCGAHFITNRWVGGLVTNFEVVHRGIKRLREIEEKLGGDLEGLTQQNLSVLRREWARLERLFGGVKTLDKLPSAIVVIDAYYERIAVRESKGAGIPVVVLVDSNTDPTGIDYPVPANDDAIKSVQLFTRCFAEAILAGNQGKGVKHEFKDFERVGVKEVSKKVEEVEEEKKGRKELKKEKKTTTTKLAKKPLRQIRQAHRKQAQGKVKRKTKRTKRSTRKGAKTKTRIKTKAKSKVKTKSRTRTKKKTSTGKSSSKAKKKH